MSRLFTVCILLIVSALILVSCGGSGGTNSGLVKSQELAQGLDFSAPQLKEYSNKISGGDVWFTDIPPLREIPLVLGTASGLNAQESKQVCEDTCNSCGQKIGKKMSKVVFKEAQANQPTHGCGCQLELGQSADVSDALACVSELQYTFASTLFDKGLVRSSGDVPNFQRDKEVFFTFDNFNRNVDADSFCKGVCGYCGTKFGKGVNTVSADTSQGLKCTCNMLSDSEMNNYQLYSCIADFTKILPKK